MPKRGDLECAADIAEAIRRIEAYTEGITYQNFLADTKTQDAVVRNLEIIGEAVKKMSGDFKAKHEDIDWKGASGMRDRLIHDYFGVNWSIVWDVTISRLPELKSQIDQLLKSP